MNTISLILAFMQIALKDAKSYTDEAVSAIVSGMRYIGAVDYYADLANVTKEVGYVYSVLYAGSSGTEPDGTEYVWGEHAGSLQWIPLGPNITSKADKVKNGTANNIAAIDGEGNLKDSGKGVDATPTAGSDNLITSGAVHSGLSSKAETGLGITGASIGQFPKVKTVDAQGVPTSFEPGDAGGGSGSSWSDIWPTIPDGGTQFETDDTYWNSDNVGYENGTVKEKLDSLSEASGIIYENTNVAAALDSKSNKADLIADLIEKSQTSTASIITANFVSTPPAASTDDGLKYQLAFDTSYLYVCIEDNTWRRVALSTF